MPILAPVATQQGAVLLLFYDGHCVRLRLSDADDSRLGSFGVELPAGLNGDQEPIVEENGQQE